MLPRDGRGPTARATRVKVIRESDALRSATYWVEPPADYDRAGVWRLGGTVALVLGLAALNEARTARSLPSFQRAVAAGFATTYAAGGAYTLATPQWIARGIIVHPRWTLAAAFAPLAAEGLSGGARTPLHLLTAASAGASALVYGQRTGARAAQVAGLVWSVQARATSSPARPAPPAAWVYLVLPLTYQIAARLTTTFASLAYQARSLDAMLRDLALERSELRGIAEQLDTTLRDADPQLRALLPDADPARRNLTLRALGRLQETRAAIRIALLQDREDAGGRFVKRVRSAFRARGLGAPYRPVPARRQSVASICEEQRAGLAEFISPDVEVSIDIDPQMTVEGIDRIAVLAATVTAGIVNALRHAERLSAVAISAQRLEDGRVQLRIVNDGVSGTASTPEPGKGLQTLGRELARVLGTLEAQCLEEGRFELLATLPVRGSEQDTTGQLMPWTEIDARVDALLAETVHMCGAMVAAQLIGGRPRRRAVRGALLTMLPPVAYALGERRGRAPTWPLVAAAAASAVADGPRRGLLCGWTNAALARHALRSKPVKTEALLAVNVAALAGSYVQARNRAPLGGQLATLVAGPLATTRIVRPAIERLQDKERDVIATLSAIETVHWIAKDLMDNHGCLGPIRELSSDPEIPSKQRADLAGIVSRIKRAAGEYGSTEQRPLSGLVGAVSTVIGRRVWPASLHVQIQEAPTIKVDPGLARMRVRRTAIAVADAVAREVIGRRPARLDGSRGVQRVELRVSGQRSWSTVEFRVRPVEVRDADRRRRLCERIDQLGAAVVDWRDDELAFAVYAMSESALPFERATSL